MNCEFIEEKNGYKVLGYQTIQNNTLDLFIDTHQGLPIIEIDMYAFLWSALNSVTIGQNSTHQININSYAFNEAAIPTINLNNNVTFDDEFFDGKSNSVFTSSTLQRVILPSTLDAILPMMFQNCIQLQSISFKGSPTQVNILPTHITAIYAYAFSGCELASLFVPNSVEKMEVAVFDAWSMDNEQEIYIDITEDRKDELIELWKETDGEEGWHEFWDSGCVPNVIEFWSTLGLSYTLLSNGTYRASIGTATSESDIIFTSYYNGKQVYEIAANGFINRSNILSISLPRALEIIGNNAFANCANLAALKIYGNAVNLGFGMLSGCNSLTSLTIPFAGNTFEGSSNTNFGYIFGTTDINSQQNYVPASLETVTITEARSIASNAFWNCVYLKDITVSNSVEIIGISAFGQCTSLTSLTIPFVGARADMTTFTYFTYIIGGPASVAPPSLKTVIITGGSKIPSQAFASGCQYIETIIIPNSVTYIGYGAFRNCRSLKNFVIPEGVEYIDNGAFENCVSLTSITIPQSVTEMHDEVFWGCNELETIIFKRPASMGVTDIRWATFCYPNTCLKLTLIAVVDSASQTAYRNLFPSDSFYEPTVNLIRYVPGLIV